MRKYLTPLLASLSLLVHGQPGKEPVKVTDMLKIQSLSGVTLSKDARRVAFTVTRIEPDQDARNDYKYVNHIYVAPADGSMPPKQRRKRTRPAPLVRPVARIPLLPAMLRRPGVVVKASLCHRPQMAPGAEGM